MQKEKTIEILNDHFKALYNYAWIEWNQDNEKNLEQLVDELEEIIKKKTNELTTHIKLENILLYK